LSPDGNTIATCSLNGRSKLWDATTGEPLHELESDGAGQAFPAFSPEGQWVITGGADRTIRFWDVRTGEKTKTLRGHEDLPYNYAFTKDGSRMLSGGKLGSIMLWDVESGSKIRDYEGHERWINSVTIIEREGEDALFASASDEGVVRLWSMDTGETLLVIRVKNEAMYATASPDGKQLAVIDDLQVKLYPLDLSLYERAPEELLEQAQSEARMKLEGFSLTPADSH
jgi:WD40 repeat protein